MSIETMTAETGVLEILYDSFAEQGIDCDIAMPDYCPDIEKILKEGLIEPIPLERKLALNYELIVKHGQLANLKRV